MVYTLFSILFSYMLLDAFLDLDKGVYIKLRTDGGLFNLNAYSPIRRRYACLSVWFFKLLYADDCALVAHTLEDIQQITNAFARAAERFGLRISLKKTEVMCQPAPRQPHSDPVVTVNLTKHLSSLLTNSATTKASCQTDPLLIRIAKAISSFGRLRQRLSHTMLNYAPLLMCSRQRPLPSFSIDVKPGQPIVDMWNSSLLSVPCSYLLSYVNITQVT